MTSRCLVLLVAAALLAAGGARADAFRPAYLELRQVDAERYDVLWKVPAQGDLRLGLSVVWPEDVETIGEARAEFAAGAFVERSRVRRAGGLAGASVRIEGLSASGSEVLARIERSDGGSQVERLLPARPAFTVAAATGRAALARSYLGLGIAHILGGLDHLLFVLSLLLLVRGARRVVATITAFTVAHSLSLAAATLGLVHVAQPPVDAAVALSIVFVAAEIVRSRRGEIGLAERAPWLVAFAFGLLHGLGFASALATVGLPERAIPFALLFFNVGVEIGQLLFVASALALALLLRSARLPAPRWAALAPAYAIGAVAAAWLIQRIGAFGAS